MNNLYETFNDLKIALLQLHYTSDDVLSALSKERLSPKDFAALLSPAAETHLEQMAEKSRDLKSKHHGNAVNLFTPLYLSNYCDNHCLYCGFSCKNPMVRTKLSLEEASEELAAIRRTGLREILLLTGESLRHTPLEYLSQVVRESKTQFQCVGLEIMPLDVDAYTKLHKAGADFVSVYQETYDETLYRQVHLKGRKRDFRYRFDAQERALTAGMHGVAFGALFGLGSPFEDALATGLHAMLIHQKYPYAEIGFSVPRMRPIHSPEGPIIDVHPVTERQLLQIMLAYRLFMPFSTITLSTRERAFYRDHACQWVVNKVSAEAKVGVGGHVAEEKSDVQFEIADPRTVEEMVHMLETQNLQPVFSSHIHL